jgi:predicted DCC family thiol-disulfide oxidoreductase YuxK
MLKLHILYDAQCPFILRYRHWLGEQTALMPLEFIPFQSPELVARFEGIAAYGTKVQLLAVNDEGGVYQGTGAFIICLFALKDYRDWAVRLSAPHLLPLAAEAFDMLSSGGKEISRWLSRLDDAELINVLGYEACRQSNQRQQTTYGS